MLQTHSELLKPCCEKCWHSLEKPCSTLIQCIHEGPLCHVDELCTTKRKHAKQAVSRVTSSQATIYVGMGSCGLGAGADKTATAIRNYCATQGFKATIIEIGCIGFCAAEPIVDIVMPGRSRISFQKVYEKEVPKLLDSVRGGTIPQEMVIGQFASSVCQEQYSNVAFLNDHQFFKPQTRLVLDNCGIIDPSSLDEYLLTGGYQAFSTVLHSYTPEKLCDTIEKSGLRGRGGGGFPTGKKWKMALTTPSDQKYFVCNADEGDPGAFMDRALIEGDPHKLIEGLALGAYAIGASKAYVYIRAEYPLAIVRLKNAIEQARSTGILGHNIFDSGFNLSIVIKEGAGAFVCGEETALLHSIEGKRGMPRPRPPFPSTSGLFNHPTIINNVETLANCSYIISHGWEKFASLGTATSKGTKVFALSGKICNTGLVEVEMGKTIEDIVFTIGAGVTQGKKFKAVQIGGPSGGCIPASQIKVTIDYESLKSIGAIMGSGGLVVMDEDNCMVDVAKFFLEFIQRESCGKCTPCREGTRRMLEILKAITRSDKNETPNQTLERMKGVTQLYDLALVIKDTSLCGLGNTAPNPVLSTLRWFKHEYDAHVFNRQCPAGACMSLVKFSIDSNKCKGCTICSVKCPTEAIRGSKGKPHEIITERCIVCGSCIQVCKLNAVIKV